MRGKTVGEFVVHRHLLQVGEVAEGAADVVADLGDDDGAVRDVVGHERERFMFPNVVVTETHAEARGVAIIQLELGAQEFAFRILEIAEAFRVLLHRDQAIKQLPVSFLRDRPRRVERDALLVPAAERGRDVVGRLGLGTLGDHVEHAARVAKAEEHRGRSLDKLDALHLRHLVAGAALVEVAGVVEVVHARRPRLEAADLELVGVIGVAPDTRHEPNRLVHARHALVLEEIGRDDTDGQRRGHQRQRDARAGGGVGCQVAPVLGRRYGERGQFNRLLGSFCCLLGGAMIGGRNLLGHGGAGGAKRDQQRIHASEAFHLHAGFG